MRQEMHMEFHSPVYELLFKCERMSMHLPKAWDLISEPDLMTICKFFLESDHGH
jgi:hypothetical protein